MKKPIILLFPFLMVLSACDQFKEDKIPNINLNVNFLPDEPVMVYLDGYPNRNNQFDSYELISNSSNGSAQIIDDRFFVYNPISNLDDVAQVSVKGINGLRRLN